MSFLKAKSSGEEANMEDEELSLGHFFLNFNFNLLYLLIVGCIGSSLLHLGFLWCGKQGLLFIAVHGLLFEVASLVAEHGL